MQWCIILIILALAKSSTAAHIPDSEEVQKPPSVNCTEYFSGYDGTLDSDDILGVWYQMYEESDEFNCFTFQKLTEEKRQTIAAILKPYINETDFGRFTLMAINGCPEHALTRTDFHLLTKTDDKGVFDVYLVPEDRSYVVWRYVSIYMKVIEEQGKTYLGILPCDYLIDGSAPDLFERESNGTHTKHEIRDLEFVFNNNQIIH